MKPLILILVLFSFSFANATKEQIIANALKEEALNANIDKRLLYTLAKIESNFEPLIIAFTSKNKINIMGNNIDLRHLKYKDKFLIQIRSDAKTLEKIALYLLDKGFNIDIGLMQINSINFTKEEIPYLFNPSYNIKKAIKVLKTCKSKFNSLKQSIECYNKGNRLGVRYDYYANFTRHFIRDFGGVR
ncbi:transglycosylase SLT domain-containing protein [Campylobacter helveticus]|uniref:Lytic transglycosylase domain-containing protein n=1 Tax=Campylobacter helveticus TaxID=28898 RepID=A0AAX2ULE2_9BACT|nr:transglycosylase SLT domain-containing protein [Campylobacter helveticus]ELU1350187.1 transglycosylase SLT domain-containing protein [Campylobacter jejuni]ARE81418.1 lysozyme domain protein [Campylobacter helveticus]MCR2039821.1 transglycosylase SLT domain-containing protein [Campylobacter helveticus]MCR2054827.1 transglycosylase SLT domain-containing protein [Campylobacter helveticus]MCR2060338.1 transglycosylase SLT domain-containing protein [Campylobacter helveticus]